jgi:ubiquinone/menaquinone biosynthesis C-methylase UbiE
MSIFGWDQMTDWWDKRFGDEGDLWHRALIDPPLLRLVGEVSQLHVLDLACGNGYLSRRFARQGAIVTSVDANALIVERACAREAQEPLGIIYHVSDAANLQMLEENSFDLVVCNMAIMDVENAVGAIEEVARVLRLKGRFVASLAHPCFDKEGTSGWQIEHIYPKTTVWRKMSRYREIATHDLPWIRASDQIVYTHIYHRPLSWYFQTLRAAGLVVAAFEEPEPTEEFLVSESPQGPWIAEIPLHCVIEAWKIHKEALPE